VPINRSNMRVRTITAATGLVHRKG
jgi:hypothetical protein